MKQKQYCDKFNKDFKSGHIKKNLFKNMLANNHQVRQNVIGAVRMILRNATDESMVGTITTYPLNCEDGVAGEGFLEVDAFTLDLEGQEGLDDAKIGGRDI